MTLIDWLIEFLFENISPIWKRHNLPVKGFSLCLVFNLGGIFIVLYLRFTRCRLKDPISRLLRQTFSYPYTHRTSKVSFIQWYMYLINGEITIRGLCISCETFDHTKWDLISYIGAFSVHHWEGVKARAPTIPLYPPVTPVVFIEDTINVDTFCQILILHFFYIFRFFFFSFPLEPASFNYQKLNLHKINVNMQEILTEFCWHATCVQDAYMHYTLFNT